jgi:hypothetical protein
MLRKGVTLTALIPLLAACGLPQGLSQQDVLAYETAVASVGCVMRVESDYLPVELQTGFTREQVVGLTEYELATGNAVKLDDGGVKLTTGACA